MLDTIFSIFSFIYKVHKYFMLQMFCIIDILLQLLLPRFEDVTYYRC
ncbi:Uncharacterised protein [Segatella copri]|nr:Uncharacterised protein [Segatella copri]